MICVKCKTEKSLDDFYKQKAKKLGYSSYCKSCSYKIGKALRFNISESFLEYLHSYTECMCCGTSFKDELHRHIHHTDEGVQGIICRGCNHILRQETSDDLKNIESVIAYIHSDRKILGRLSELIKRERKITYNITPCDTEYGRQCNACKRFYTEDSFRPYGVYVCVAHP